MTAQLCSRRRLAVFRAGIAAVAPLLVFAVRERAMATPVAQAYGLAGTACRTQLPMQHAGPALVIRDDEFGAAGLAEVNAAGLEGLPTIDVGVPHYARDDAGGRRGTKSNFVRNIMPAQAAYDGSAGADRSLQRRVAYADPAKPQQAGSALKPGVHVDRYDVADAYITNDPRPGLPSSRCEYPTATGGNPAYPLPPVASNSRQPAGSTPSSWTIGSAGQIVEHDRGALNFSYYHTIQAPGQAGVTGLIPQTGWQTGGGPGFSYAIDPYTRFYTTVYLQNQRPALSILMRFQPPLWSHLK